MKTKYLIVGNSVAGVNCIEGIRRIDKQGKIVVISDEDIYNYSRPLISYYLAGKISRDEMSFKGKEFYKENNVELVLNTTAERIDIEKKEVVTDKFVISFDTLCISTGGKPFIPDVEGYLPGMRGVFTFINFSDAENLRVYIEEKKIRKGVILGGGLIGLKCAEGLIARGLEVSIIEMADRLLASTFDKEASKTVEALLKKKRCNVFTEETVKKIERKKNSLSGIILTSGQKIDTELLVIAVGVKPNIKIVKDTPVKCNRGILVNEYMMTSIPSIYAAGDVAEGKDIVLNRNSVIAIWPVAARQGKVAGMNMAGAGITYEGLFPMNAVDIIGIPVISFGITNPEETDKYEVLSKKDGYVYKKIVLENNRIVGCIFLGNVERSGIFSGLIKNRVNVGSFKDDLLKEGFGLLVLPDEYRKHMVVGEGIEV
ncbi:MAG: FAD-dependent oxidoreductase [Candidatus Omnitrophica bacterium]|nr:FAD-dependent oxidoreductase [Candidatus Omnitrophota bacterium]